MGGSPAPQQDPAIGEAALLSAQTGTDFLDWMKDAAKQPTQWAEDDRARYLDVFQPIQDQLIADAQGYDTPERRAAEEDRSVATLRQSSAIADATRERQMGAMGIDPRSGRYRALDRRAGLDSSLAELGARNTARRNVEAMGDAKMADAVNMGMGLAVNPGTSLGIASGIQESGFNGALSGYGQQGNLLNQQYQNQLSTWQANQSAKAGLWGGLGTALGAGLSLWSSKEMKTDKKKRPKGASLGAVKDMPVEGWRYKDGMGDGSTGSHVGPYAEDFQKATGLGDGQTIPIVDAIGVTMGAVQDLAATVDDLAKKVEKVA